MSKKSLNECMVICKIVRRVFFANKLLMMMMMMTYSGVYTPGYDKSSLPTVAGMAPIC
jgi:hypothetical protein